MFRSSTTSSIDVARPPRDSSCSPAVRQVSTAQMVRQVHPAATDAAAPMEGRGAPVRMAPTAPMAPMAAMGATAGMAARVAMVERVAPSSSGIRPRSRSWPRPSRSSSMVGAVGAVARAGLVGAAAQVGAAGRPARADRRSVAMARTARPTLVTMDAMADRVTPARRAEMARTGSMVDRARSARERARSIHCSRTRSRRVGGSCASSIRARCARGPRATAHQSRFGKQP